jgi:UPF0716 protein FxsA
MTTSAPRRRRIPFWVLVVLFIGLPALEIYVLIQIGQVIGAWWTILLLLADGVAGALIVKHEGRRAWAALTEALRAHRVPTHELADAGLVLVGGTLLLTPGFVTDVFGFFCVLPFTRPVARRALTQVIARRFVMTAARSGRRTDGAPPVVPGDVVD